MNDLILEGLIPPDYIYDHIRNGRIYRQLDFDNALKRYKWKLLMSSRRDKIRKIKDLINKDNK